MNLFDGEIIEHGLFDAMRRRVIYRQKLTKNEAENSNRHFEKSLCPHLKWLPSDEIKTRVYTIRK